MIAQKEKKRKKTSLSPFTPFYVKQKGEKKLKTNLFTHSIAYSITYSKLKTPNPMHQPVNCERERTRGGARYKESSDEDRNKDTSPPPLLLVALLLLSLLRSDHKEVKQVATYPRRKRVDVEPWEENKKPNLGRESIKGGHTA